MTYTIHKFGAYQILVFHEASHITAEHTKFSKSSHKSVKSDAHTLFLLKAARAMKKTLLGGLRLPWYVVGIESLLDMMESTAGEV